MSRSLQLDCGFDFEPLAPNGELVACGAGPDGELYLALSLNPPAKPSRSQSNDPQDYRVIALLGGEVALDLTILDQDFYVSGIQPMPNGELLLVNARAEIGGPKNGRIYTADGQFLRDMYLGDGIEDVQANADGSFWTSYFDEGVYGDPIGQSGLVARDTYGNPTYEYDREGKLLGPIDDCYALNVTSASDTWIYYYSDFPLVHLQNNKIKTVWNPDVKGSHAFAIAPGFALFAGEYDARDQCILFKLVGGGGICEMVRFKLLDEAGMTLKVDRVVGRADTLHIIRNKKIYRLDVAMAFDMATS